MYSLKGAEEEGKHCRSWMSKGSCSKGGKCSFKHDTAKKGKGKGKRSRSLSKETIPQNDTMPERQGKLHLDKKAVLRVSTTKEDIIVVIESMVIGISRLAHT